MTLLRQGRAGTLIAGCVFVALLSSVCTRCAAEEAPSAPAAPSAGSGDGVSGNEAAPPQPAPEVPQIAVQPAEPQIQLSLAETIEKALRTNLDIRIVGYQPLIAGADIDRQGSVFDPMLSASLSYLSRKPPILKYDSFQQSSTTSTSTVYARDGIESTAYLAGLSARSALGGTVSLSTGVTKNDIPTSTVAIDKSSLARSILSQDQEYYEGDLTLQVTQPLLKNAGSTVNRAALRIAQNTAKGSTFTFESQVMNLVLNTTAAYWNLVQTREDLKAREKALQAAQDLLKHNIIYAEAGSLPPIEVTRARSRVSDREEAIVTARAAIKDAEDKLRGILDSSSNALLSDAEIIPTDVPTVYAEELDVASAVHEALAARPEIRQRTLDLENAGIALARSKHQLLPEVDLQATYKLYSYGYSWDENTDITKLDRRDVTAALVVNLPLGNREARSNYVRDRYLRLQALTLLEALQRDITLDVKKAVRDIATSLQSIDTNQLRKQYAQENLEAEVQKYNVGQSISLNVLDAQDALQQAESAYIQSIVGFNVAMANFYRTTGRLLRKYDIDVVPLATVKKNSQSLSQ